MTTLASDQPLWSPLRVLQAASQQKLTGCLTLSAPGSEEHSWQVYWGEGRIHFATSSGGTQERLPYLWQQHSSMLGQLPLAPGQSDYQLLRQVWQQGQLAFSQLRQLLLVFSQEALVHLLALPQVEFQFEAQGKLEPLLIAVPLAQALAPVESQIQQWQQLQPEIGSPFHCPWIKDAQQLDFLLQQSEITPAQRQLLTHILQQRQSLYAGATWLRLNTLELATLLHPWIQAGAVGLALEQQRSETEVSPRQRLETALRSDRRPQPSKEVLHLAEAGYHAWDGCQAASAPRSLEQSHQAG